MKDLQLILKQFIRSLNANKWIILSLVGISLLYYILRFTNILSLPIFTDEAIYVRWGEIAKQDASWRFISLTDGKQPLFIWIMMVVMKFIHDPLLAGRTVSVFAGFGTLLGLFFLTKNLFKNAWIGVIASVLYLFYPMGLVYDRMAIYDSLVATTMVWSLYSQVLLIRKIQLDRAIIAGFVMGLAVLNKTIGFLAIDLLPFSLLLFPFKIKRSEIQLVRWVLFALLAAIIANGMYSILRLSPFFHIIAEKDTIFVYPVSQWIHFPLHMMIENFRSNMSGLINWFVVYVSIPVILVIAVSFFISQKFLREKLLLLAWFILPFIALGVVGKTLYPRYILFMTIPLLSLGAYTIYCSYLRFKNALIVSIVLVLLFLMQLRADWYVLSDFKDAPIPNADKGQYINGWPAGGGVKETVQYLQQQAQTQKIYVATEGTYGLMPYSLEIYLVQNPNIIIKGYWPIGDTLPQPVLNAAKSMPTYFVFYQPQHQQIPVSMPLKLIFSYQEGNSNYYYRLYQVMP